MTLVFREVVMWLGQEVKTQRHLAGIGEVLAGALPGTMTRRESFVSTQRKEQTTYRKATADRHCGWRKGTPVRKCPQMHVYPFTHWFWYLFIQLSKYRVPALCQALYQELGVQKPKTTHFSVQRKPTYDER